MKKGKTKTVVDNVEQQKMLVAEVIARLVQRSPLSYEQYWQVSLQPTDRPRLVEIEITFHDELRYCIEREKDGYAIYWLQSHNPQQTRMEFQTLDQAVGKMIEECFPFNEG